jgi:DNA-binding IscR family transcriptional regulator
MPFDRKNIGKFLAFYFKPRRKDHGKEMYVYRAAIHDCLKEGQIYAAQLQKKYGLSAMRSHKILQEMRDAGILQSKKYGGMVVYTFAIEVHEVASITHMIDGILDLKGEMSRTS